MTYIQYLINKYVELTQIRHISTNLFDINKLIDTNT
jgi:hypothetical protein